jgi:hypothetical protein
MKTKTLNVRIQTVLLVLLIAFCTNYAKAQISFPLTNISNCDVKINYEVTDSPCPLSPCDFGTIVIPAGGSVIIGSSGSCNTIYDDVHVVLMEVGGVTVPGGGGNNVGDPGSSCIISSGGSSNSGTIPAGNPCAGTWNMLWTATGITIW